MKKEKYHIEYVFDLVSGHSLWNHISSGLGLSAWFAEEVNINQDVYEFVWGNTSERAIVISKKEGEYIRFRWEQESDTNGYFEFRLHTIELTGGVSLEITDFALPEDKRDAIDLWDAQVENLTRTLGI